MEMTMATTTTRRHFLQSLSAAGMFSVSSSLFCSPKTTRKPNIIFILADDLGYGDLGCYGQQAIQTPRLDQMAAEGLRFTQFYAGSTVCAPSRCCLMTGLHSGHARIRGNALVPLEQTDVTVAEILQERGYRTALIGKWGLGEEGTSGIPNQKGFDYFYGYLNQVHAHSYYPAFLWENEKQVPLRNKVIYSSNGYAQNVGSAAVERIDYTPDLFSSKAQEFVRLNASLPFFLTLAFTTPHANNEFALTADHGMETPDYGIYAEQPWPDAQKGHAAMITRMDQHIGLLFDLLKELDLDENTLVFFSSDNGPHKEGGFSPTFHDSNGPLRGIKRDLYEGGIRVPMIVRWPEHISPGSVCELPFAFWDILPTCAELSGAQNLTEVDGISLAPLLTGSHRKQKTHDYLYWEFHEGKASSQALRMGDWKSVRLDPRGALELYNMAQDIGEEHDVASQYPTIVHDMQSILAVARTENDYWPLKSAE
ncbi:MAG: N-acetylgalactosamine-6-sulfatase [Calditrichaeota bacterium]|nr:MAG: N-acetylgalactosamine-6-sulfatase [Calditrichota bacterium]